MTKNGQKMAIFESSIFRIFSSKIEKSGNRKNCVLWCNLWSNWDLDRSSTPKMTVWSYFLWNMFMWLPKKWPEMVVKWATHTVVAFICSQSIINGIKCSFFDLTSFSSRANSSYPVAWKTKFEMTYSLLFQICEMSVWKLSIQSRI